MWSVGVLGVFGRDCGHSRIWPAVLSSFGARVRIGNPDRHEVGHHEQVVVVASALLTVMAFASIPGFRRAWSGEREFPMPYWGLGKLFKRADGRRRAGPAMLVSAYVLCVASWGLILFRSGAGRVIALLLSLAWVGSIATVVTVYARGWPGFLTPPHLRGRR